jgi:hypothetical protein
LKKCQFMLPFPVLQYTMTTWHIVINLFQYRILVLYLQVFNNNVNYSNVHTQLFIRQILKSSMVLFYTVSWELLIFCCSCWTIVNSLYNCKHDWYIIFIPCFSKADVYFMSVKRKRQDDETEYQYRKRLLANTQDNNEDDNGRICSPQLV